MTLILENHYKDGYWQFPEFAQKREVFLQLLDAIPRSPWFGVNYDPSNAIIAGDDPLALLDDVKDRVVTMHASDRYFEGGTREDLQRLGAHTRLRVDPQARRHRPRAERLRRDLLHARSAPASAAGSASKTATTRAWGWSICGSPRSFCARR